MSKNKKFLDKLNQIPIIKGAGGGKGSEPVTAPNSLFSTDILFLVLALGEGPIYRNNPNGPQDIQIQDSSIDDLVRLDGDGSADTDKFYYVSTAGTLSQKPLPFFGDEIVNPQSFAAAVSLKKGNLDGIPENKVSIQETSDAAWDSLRFNFVIDGLARGTGDGNVYQHSVTVKIDIYDSIGSTLITSVERTITGKSDTAVKFSVAVPIPEESISANGYRFTITKTSDDNNDSKIFDDVKIVGWDEIRNEKLAYPRTSLLALALKAVNEHQGTVPTFTSLQKGMIVKVPSNYNQPTLASSEIDWRHLETPESGDYGYTTNGYYQQFSGSTLKKDANPNIYSGVWDGTFVYAWTQNPVWIAYDILTNKVYGLGIPENNIDKFTFYKLAMYCDACDFYTGNFIGVDGLSDGSFRSKPVGKFTSNRENQLGIPKGTPIKERRFVCDISIADQNLGIDTLNELLASIRTIPIYSGGKISLASDMPDEYPAMIFNESNIKKGTINISGYKLSDVVTAVDATYIDPTNHFTRETIRVDANEVNNGSPLAEVDNTLNIDLKGVTRRSQAMRAAQYLLASSRYQKRSIAFTTGTEALYLSPGSLISISSKSSGVDYGFGGKIKSNSAIASSGNTTVYLEHFSYPAISNSVITANTYPLALRITKQDTDRTDLYIVSNSTFSTSSDYAQSIDSVELKVLQKYDPITKTFGSAVTEFSSNTAPVKGDLWSFGEIINPLNFYTSKAGRLFKVKEVKRADSEEVQISAVEYIPEVYEDSDTFIDYEPIEYVDVVNYLEVPPTPKLEVTTKPRRRSDGSIATDAFISASSPTDGFSTEFETKFEISNPSSSVRISNVTVGNPITINYNSGSLSNNQPAVIEGKNGFTVDVGAIPMLCNSYSTANLGYITLTVPGLDLLIDDNFNTHVLEVNNGALANVVKGSDLVSIPIHEKTTNSGILNFVGYADPSRTIARTITSYDIPNNTITIEDTASGLNTLSDSLLPTPFYVTLSQVLQVNNYSNNSFFVSGYSGTYKKEGNLTASPISLEVRPRQSDYVRFYVDGIEKNAAQYTVNINEGVGDANISYSAGSGDSTYRVEVDYYLPPMIEAGDTIEDDNGNTYIVTGTSYDFEDPSYNVQLTANCIYKLETLETPASQLAGQRFVNITNNPTGIISNVTANTATFSYDDFNYLNSVSLANSRCYSLSLNSNFEPVVPVSDSVIPDLPIGTTILRARNRNLLGRVSSYTQKTIEVETLPLPKVQNLSVIESLYREQTGGVAVRATVSFDHITDRDVTDYEISYKIDTISDTLGKDTSGVTSYNTIKLPASGVNEAGKMLFTLNNIDRGESTEANSLSVKVTPLNKDIRGKTASITQTIVGKTSPPDNIFNFAGGQQGSQITLLWSYPRVGDQLKDLDLKEVVIRRIPGSQEISLDTYAAASPLVTVSVGTARKSIPIDSYGTFTYLARTRDTSDNLSTDVVGTVITTTRPQRSQVIAAYSEDDPATRFSTLIHNTNNTEYYFASFSNSNTGGISYSYTSSVDNANGSSSGWSAIGGQPTDLLADADAEYITQIRELDSVVTAAISLDIAANQVLQASYTDQKTVVLSGVSEVSGSSNVFVEVDFGGIGHLLGFANANVVNARYDANNKTWMTGGASGNVWALWSPASTGSANANSYALIAGLINANAVALGETFYANGDPTGGNALANMTTIASSYQLVNLTQYSDISSLTYQGDLGAITTQTFIRTSSSDSIYHANGSVDITTFDNYLSDDGWTPYEAGSRTFKAFQIKYNVYNSDSAGYDFYLDRFKYTVDKEQTITSNTIAYSSSPTIVDYTSQNYLRTPVVSYAILDQIDAEANPSIVITTSLSNTNVAFKLLASDGTGEYNANSTANVMVTIVGV